MIRIRFGNSMYDCVSVHTHCHIIYYLQALKTTIYFQVLNFLFSNGLRMAYLYATPKAFVGTVPRGLNVAGVAPHLSSTLPGPAALTPSASGHGVMVTAAGSKRRWVGRGSYLGGGNSHIFLRCSSLLPGEMIHFYLRIFFKWVETQPPTESYLSVPIKTALKMSGLERNHGGEMVQMIFLCNKNAIFRFQPPIFQGVMEVELGGRICER